MWKVVDSFDTGEISTVYHWEFGNVEKHEWKWMGRFNQILPATEDREASWVQEASSGILEKVHRGIPLNLNPLQQSLQKIADHQTNLNGT
jgi:hypothetical protein